MPNSPEHNDHRLCDRLRELGYPGDGCPTVTDVAALAIRLGVDEEEVGRLLA